MDFDLNYNLISRVAVGDILRRVGRRYPDKTAIIDGERRVTFRELDELANRFANHLLERGLQRGDRVAVLGFNSLEFVACYFGVFKAGLVWVPINIGLTNIDIQYIIANSESKLIFVDQILLPKLDGLVQDPAWQGKITILEGQAAGFSSFADNLAEERSEPQVFIADRDPAFIMYTSGTTGKPKGVVQSHLSIFVTSLANVVEVSITSKDIAATVMPMFHVAQHALTTSFIHVGVTQVIFKKFEPEAFAATVAQEKATWVFLLPMMYRALMASPAVQKDQFASVRYCLYAMTPMDEVSLNKAIDYFEAEFALATGQTEMYPATVIFKPEYQRVKQGPYWGVSSLVLDTEIMDDEGNLLGRGEVGEIVHRGPSVMNGYWKNEPETDQARKYAWHHTGDLGRFDEDGLLIFMDRKKDLIKTGGENVASVLVESVLLAYPKLANAVVVGLPHLQWGEAVTAIVVPKPGEMVAAEEVIAFCKTKLAGFQVPKEVILVEELPANTSGKILKFRVRQQYKDHFSASEENPAQN